MNIKKYTSETFDQIKHFSDEGNEFWYARELASVLDYKRWDKFKNVIEKAKESCNNSGLKIEDHFSHVGNMVDLGSGAQREIENIMLTRYACYLIVQNGDPRKEVIALGQTYFAVKTRERELDENYEQLTDDQKRLAIRNEMINHNKSLTQAAQIAGIDDPKDYAIFQNKGYQGLYGGLGVKDIHQRKGLKKSLDEKLYRPVCLYVPQASVLPAEGFANFHRGSKGSQYGPKVPDRTQVCRL